MNPQDHSKTLGLIYTFFGGLFTLLLLASPFIIAVNIDDAPSPRRAGQILIAIVIFIIVLLLTTLLASTAYGLFKRRSWVRIPALILAALSVWFFPLGTALTVYTWWFVHSEGAKQLYAKSEGQALT
jgi:O-antigen/teichoic acid export membrane protein